MNVQLRVTAAMCLSTICGLLPATAEAVLISNFQGHGNVAFDFSDHNNKLDFDLFYHNTNPVSFDATLETGDTSSSLAFSAFVTNFTDQGIIALTVDLSGGPIFTEANLINAGQGSIKSVSGLNTPTLLLTFDEFLPPGDRLQLGLPDHELSRDDDFFITLSGIRSRDPFLGPGDTFSVRILATPVPEPSSLALLGMGILGFAGYGCRGFRRKNQ